MVVSTRNRQTGGADRAVPRAAEWGPRSPPPRRLPRLPWALLLKVLTRTHTRTCKPNVEHAGPFYLVFILNVCF